MDTLKRKNGNKYLIFTSTDKNKKVLTKYTKHWDGIKGHIKKIKDKPGDYEKKIHKKSNLIQIIIFL